MKKIAVEEELPDVYKREAIKDATGFNITKAIEIRRETLEGVEDSGVKQRRVAVSDNKTENNGPTRRVSTPSASDNKYNIIKKL
jgi:hypothetical protein